MSGCATARESAACIFFRGEANIDHHHIVIIVVPIKLTSGMTMIGLLKFKVRFCSYFGITDRTFGELLMNEGQLCHGMRNA